MKKFLSISALLVVAILSCFAVPHIGPDAIANTLNFKSAISLAGLPLVMDPSRMRAAYDRVKNIASALNKAGYGRMIVNNDFFRSEQVLANDKTSYQFQTWQKVMDSDRASFPLQQGVSDKDLFIGTSMGLFIDNRPAAGTNVILQSYPNLQHFTTNTATPAALWSIYNAILSVTVDRTVYIPRIDTSGFLSIPQTQQSSTGTTAATNQSEFSFLKALKLQDPYILFSGGNTNYLTLQITASGTWTPAGTNSTQNVVTIYMTGITVQSGADFIGAFSDIQNFAALESNEQGGKLRSALASMGIQA